MYTIFGGKGFVGSNIANKLKESNLEIFIPSRDDNTIYERELGNVIYCIGLTSDFRERPYDTVEAHVCYLAKVLKNTMFQSFTYISSTRVYYNSNHGSEERDLVINSNNIEDLYNISKLMGESLCLNCRKKNIKVVRLSNVCGDDFNSNNFLYSIIRDACNKGEIILKTPLDSEKDYIGIKDAVNMIIKVSDSNNYGIYNLGSGENISNKAITDILKEITNCSVKVDDNAKVVKFSNINIDRLKKEFGFQPLETKELIKGLVYKYKLSKMETIEKIF